MIDEVNQSPSSPMEGSPDVNPLIAIHPSVEEKHNIMTLEELNALRKTYSFPPGVRVRLPDEGETITSARPGEVAFYEAAFPAGLRFPLHSTIRLILQFYNICPAQLIPNAWRSIACSMAMWRVFKYTLSLFEFRNLFSLNSNPKPDLGWLYFKARKKKAMLRGYPSNVKGWKSKFFFVSSDGWEIPKGTSLLLESKSFSRVFSPGSMASRTVGDKIPSGDASSLSGDVAMSKRVSFKKIGEKLGKLANVSSGTPVPAKGVVIGEKRAGDSLSSSPNKKGRADDGSKGKGVDSEAGGKKKASSSSENLGRSSHSSFMPRGRHWCSARLWPSVAGKLGSRHLFKKGRVASMETEVARLQKLAADLEQQLAESRACKQQANDELAKTKSDRDSLANKIERSGVLVNELREALDKAKESAMEEFKSSSEFVVAVEDSTSKYFGEGFDFIKVQLRWHHPDLAIDLEGTVVDQDLLAEQDEAAEENEKEKVGENEGGN
ncbi:hypothetical protein Acr_18g0009650 [Actinidia rufa]|uniref:Transposase (putative) gypsy type domain-containing protein n=1 Tax=Actinidia rufa TaxID=165716 RepID=A0A7J0G7L6_9ERIC|nr:hypothetical protein Acr_18g0009650 [Actinidia rufa]